VDTAPARRRRATDSACNVTTLGKCTVTDSYKTCAADVDGNKGGLYPNAATKAAGICACLAKESDCKACANCNKDDEGSWGWQRWLDVRSHTAGPGYWPEYVRLSISYCHLKRARCALSPCQQGAIQTVLCAMCVRARTLARASARMCPCVCITHAHTHTHARTHARTRVRARAHARTRAHTHARTHTALCACLTRPAGGCGVQAHNKYRCNHGMPPAVWDSELAAAAAVPSHPPPAATSLCLRAHGLGTCAQRSSRLMHARGQLFAARGKTERCRLGRRLGPTRTAPLTRACPFRLVTSRARPAQRARQAP
jgi:hypothetical protein